MPRWSKITLLVGGVVVVALGVAAAVAWQRLPQIVADRASAATGRAVTIGGLRIVPGRWLTVTLHDVRMANLPGGTRPEMATLAEATAAVALWPLLRGNVVARDVTVTDADILLEKVQGQPNWRNGPRKPEPADHGRPGFPTILGATVRGAITFRTSTGHALVTRLDGVKLTVPDPATPARLDGPGSYNDVPITLAIGLGSYDQLHDANLPFPADIRMTSGDTTLHFVGTMTDPLNVDGATGTLSVDAPTPEVIERVAGGKAEPAPSVQLAGPFTRDHDVWDLERATGKLGDTAIEEADLKLTEGSREQDTQDRLDATVKLGAVDADKLAASFDSSGNSGGSSGFVPEAKPDPQVAASIAARSMRYGDTTLTQPSLSLTVAPGAVTVKDMRFGALGGQVQLDSAIRAEEGGKVGTLAATVAGTGLDVSQLRRTAGIGDVPLTGKADLHAAIEGRGADAAAALAGSRSSIVATMVGGRVSAQLVELASTDIAGLFRSSSSTVAVECLLAVVETREGVATIGPLRLRSSAGTIVARGRANLRAETLDLVIASEARTTGLLALDVPVRVSGRMADPTIAPAGGSAGRTAQAAPLPAGLPAALRTQAERSRCAR